MRVDLSLREYAYILVAILIMMWDLLASTAKTDTLAKGLSLIIDIPKLMLLCIINNLIIGILGCLLWMV